MSIQNDFEPDIAKSLEEEISLFGNYGCYYDENLKKIIYPNREEALKAYMKSQQAEIDRYKWIASEKANRDLGDEAIFFWIMNYASLFSIFWKKTHYFVK